MNKKLKIVIINHNIKEVGTYHRCFGFAKSLVKMGHKVYFFYISPEKIFWPKKVNNNGILAIELPLYSTGGASGAVEHFIRGIYIFCFITIRRINIVHSFNVASPMVGWSTSLVFLVKRIKRIKLVVDWDDWWGRGGLTTLNKQGKFQENVAEFLETKIPLLADRVTLHNELIKTRSINSGVKKENIFKIYNGCDWDAYRGFYNIGYSKEMARKELNLPLGKEILFFGGAIVISVPFLLEVLKEINDDNIIMIIIGPIKQEFVQLADSLGLRDRIYFEKLVNYDRFKRYLFASDILLLPRSNNSLLDKCTFPGRIGDYLLSGRPIVASDVGELSFVFREDSIGFLAKPDNKKDFAEKIIFALSNKKQSEKISNNALEIGKSKYSWENLTKDLLLRVYNK